MRELSKQDVVRNPQYRRLAVAYEKDEHRRAQALICKNGQSSLWVS